MISLMHRSEAIGYWSDLDRKMIEICHVIPIEKHSVYYNRVNTKLLEPDVRTPKYVLHLAICYAKLQALVEKTPAKTSINKFHKTCNVRASFKKLQDSFLGSGFTQHGTRQLKEELCSLKYKWEFKTNNFQLHVACPRRSSSRLRTSRMMDMLGLMLAHMYTTFLEEQANPPSRLLFRSVFSRLLQHSLLGLCFSPYENGAEVSGCKPRQYYSHYLKS